MTRNISLTAPGIHSAFRRRCVALAKFIPVASNRVNRSHWRLAWKVRHRAAGFFIVLFRRPSGETTSFSPEATCFSSGRKNGLREWCAAHGYPVRPLVMMDQLWTLATTWYWTRLQENSRRPQPDEMRSIFAGLGLEGRLRSHAVLSSRSPATAGRRLVVPRRITRHMSLRQCFS
jgi:hypothetical protein